MYFHEIGPRKREQHSIQFEVNLLKYQQNNTQLVNGPHLALNNFGCVRGTVLKQVPNERGGSGQRGNNSIAEICQRKRENHSIQFK